MDEKAICVGCGKVIRRAVVDGNVLSSWSHMNSCPLWGKAIPITLEDYVKQAKLIK